MSNHLSSRAAEDFLQLIQLSYFGGLTSWSETLSRLEALTMMCDSNSMSYTVARRTLAMSDFSIENEWTHDAENSKSEQLDMEAKWPTRTKIVRQEPQGWDEDYDAFPFLQLIPSESTGLSCWVFHQADADFFPSIPHGHLKGRKQPKLNPYTGWIYKGSQQIRRENRRNIVALWNDNTFRKFARKAIDFYLIEFPSYTGWPVANPKRLPRKR